ncbi:unnamed protein product [Scytosiphon promiscuus]
MMISDDTGGSGAEEREVKGDDESSTLPLRSPDKEVRPPNKHADEHPTDTEASLLAELQRRCEKIIELEVRLDQERERANRLERERKEEDEALSGELRDIMATVNVGAAASNTATPPPPPPPAPAAAGPANGTAADHLPFDSAAIAQQQQTNGASSKPETARATEQAPAGGSSSTLLSASGIFSEWRLGRIRGARNDLDDGGERKGTEQDGSTTEAFLTKDDAGNNDGEEQENSRDVEGLARGSVLPTDNGARRKEQAAGALRARVVQLELERAEAEDLMREKMDRSVRLEVQVEQLKNVVQSLSHTSERQESHRGWGGNGSAAASGATNPSAASDLDSLLRDVPGIDPSVLLLLHRSPWADGVIEGVRREETCFDRGHWSSKPGVLPAELSSLPHHPTGPPPQPPPPPRSLSSLSSPPFPVEKNASFSLRNSSRRPRSPSPGLAGAGTGEHKRDEDGLRGRQVEAEAEAGGSGLREKIGGAAQRMDVADFYLCYPRQEKYPHFLIHVPSHARRTFDLDKFGLPSDHWEWVGGWMVDSETEASSDQDGWIYGCSAWEISEIALGRNYSRSRSGRGDGNSKGSAPNENGPSSTASTTAGVGSRTGNASAVMSSTSEQALDSQQKQLEQRNDTVPAESASGNADAEDRRAGGKTDAGARVKTTGDGGGVGGDVGRSQEPYLRRRRLVRVRMVARVDGARESTTRVLELIRRLSSLEVLVRKLSRQVVAQQRQVTGLENQVAFLAPLQPKLRMVCSLGKKDRMRGDLLQRRLIEAENELKVLRRCMGPAGASGMPSSRPAPPPLAGAPPPRTSTLIGQTDKSASGGLVWAPQADGGGTDGSRSPDGSAAGGGGAAAWGWVGGVAQRAAGTLTRRPRTATGEVDSDEGVAGPIDIFSFDSGRGDAGTPV